MRSEAEDDQSDTSPGEEEDDASEAAETDEFESNDATSDDVERRTTSRSTHNLHWAVRSTRSTGSNLYSGISIDASSLRRSANTTTSQVSYLFFTRGPLLGGPWGSL